MTAIPMKKSDPETNDDYDLRVITRTLPLHDLPQAERGRLGVRRKAGRPLRIEPVVSEDDYHVEMAESRARAAEQDPLVQHLGATSSCDAPDRTVPLLIEQTLREAAALKWDRLRAEREGKDISTISSRRISALSRAANLLLAARDQGMFTADHRSSQFERVERLWVTTVVQVACDCLPDDVANRVIERLRVKMAGWQDRLDPGR